MVNTSQNPVNTGFFDSLLTGIFGKDETGNVKTFDLSKIIKLPEITVKADEKQARFTGLIFLGLIVGLFFFFKKRKYG